MIQRLSHGTVYVLDQDAAKRFYTEKLGFEVRHDVRMGDFRWLTVSPRGQANFELVLMPVAAMPGVGEAEVEQMRGLVRKGLFGAGVFETADCRGTYEELKAKGVEFLGAPQERPYGIEAVLRDDSGNWFSLTQRR
jgi:catechol 2,3-dioxygenase-like lactoylglutathione lyase family enzyme